MEFTTLNSSLEDIAEAVKGAWGKDILKDCSFVYCGHLVIGSGKTTEILDKNCKVNHTPWQQIGDELYLAILK